MRMELQAWLKHQPSSHQFQPSPSQKIQAVSSYSQACAGVRNHRRKVLRTHPGNSYSYSFEQDGKKFIYATDVELQEKDFDKDIPSNHFFEDADVLVLDSQYTVEEAIQKEKWGHSAFCYAIDFANAWNIKSLYLFHHEPTYDDKKIYSILQAARWYASYTAHTNVKVYLAIEGQEIEL